MPVSADQLTASRPSAIGQIPLLVLGAGAQTHTERGVSCPGELPALSDPTLVQRAVAARAALGDRAFILGHHYQRDEVIRFADRSEEHTSELQSLRHLV